jgi:pterin-4a-carbinolamine dehydratase
MNKEQLELLQKWLQERIATNRAELQKFVKYGNYADAFKMSERIAEDELIYHKLEMADSGILW